mmetsp:Transcript_67928/g.196700  ORF Transcript_67928/g.196700 Transcript_67928/m.196700 type:complete len:201 (-) Transcript_67928:600-1202(-)
MPTLTVGVVAPSVQRAIFSHYSRREVAARRGLRDDSLPVKVHYHSRFDDVGELPSARRIGRPRIDLRVVRASVAELCHIRSAPSKHLPLVRHRDRVSHADGNVNDPRMRQRLDHVRLVAFLHITMTENTTEAHAATPHSALLRQKQAVGLVRRYLGDPHTLQRQQRRRNTLLFGLQVQPQLMASVRTPSEERGPELRQHR